VIRRALALVLLVAVTGCTIHAARFDDIDGVKYDDTKPSELKSEACGFMLLFAFIPMREKSQILRVQAAIKSQANGAAITNVRVRERWMWLLFGTLLCTEVSATAYPRLP